MNKSGAAAAALTTSWGQTPISLVSKVSQAARLPRTHRLTRTTGPVAAVGPVESVATARLLSVGQVGPEAARQSRAQHRQAHMSSVLTRLVVAAVAGARMDRQVLAVPVVEAQRPTVGQAQPDRQTQAVAVALGIRTRVPVVAESLS